MAGNRDQSIAVYSSLAEKYARDGFYAKAIALYKKVLKLDPERRDVHAELARLIEEDSRTAAPIEERLASRSRPVVAPPVAEEAVEQEPPAAEALSFPEPAEMDFDFPAPPPDEEQEQQRRELQASTLFSSFEEQALEEILSSTSVRSYDEGDIIVTEGEPGSSLFLIVSGEVKVFTRGETGEHLPLAELGAGDFFGEVSLITGKPRTATITAKTTVTAIELEKENVDRIAAKHPKVHTVLEDFYTRRAQETVEAVIRRMRGEG
jgi:cAMP-dependent protein kinase regulator